MPGSRESRSRQSQEGDLDHTEELVWGASADEAQAPALDSASATLAGLDAELDHMAREQIAGAGAAQRARLVAMLTDLQQQAEGHRAAAAELRREAMALMHAADEAVRAFDHDKLREVIQPVPELNEQAEALEAQADDIDALVRRFIEQIDATGPGAADE